MKRHAWLLLLLGPLALLWPAFAADRAFLPMHAAQFAPLDRWADPALATRFLGPEQRWNGDTVDKLFPIWTDALAMRDEGLLWSTLSCGGSPTLAHALEGFLYPPNLLLQVLDPLDAYPILAVLTLFLASVLAYAFLRASSLSRLACLVGATAYGLGAYQTASLHYYMRVDAALWLPLALLSIQRAERVGGRWPILGLAFALGMSALAGFPQITFFVAWAAGLQIAISAWRLRRREGARAASGFALAQGGAIGLGLLLAAVQLLPSQEGSSQSTRTSTLDPRAAWERAPTWAEYGMDPRGACALAFPYLLGSPSDGLMTDDPLPWMLLDDPYRPGATNQVLGYNFLENQLYFGALPLVLALVALVAWPRRALAPAAGFLTCFAFALAPLPSGWLHAPLRALYCLPLLQVGAPTRMLALAGFFGAWLAALGVEALVRGHARARTAAVAGALVYLGACALVVWGASEDRLARRAQESLATRAADGSAPSGLPRVARDVATYGQDGRLTSTELERIGSRIRGDAWRIAAALALGLAALAGWRRFGWARAGAALLCVAVATDLVFVGRTPNEPVPRAGLFAEPPPIAALRAQVRADGPAPHRIVRAAVGFDEILRLLRPNLAAMHGIPDVSGYIVWASKRLTDLFQHARVGVAYADRWVAYLPLALAYPPGESVPLIHPLLDATGIGWIVTHHELPGAYPGPERQRIADELELVYEDRPPGDDPTVSERFRVYRRRTAMPRAWLVPRAVAIAERDPLVERLKDPAADYRAELVLWSGDLEAGQELPIGTASPQELVVARYEPTEVVLRKEGGGSGYAYLSDVWWPGWTAWVNGEERPILPANYAFRAVYLAEDEDEVIFRYAPTSLTWGAALSALSLLLLLALSGPLGRRRALESTEDER